MQQLNYIGTRKLEWRDVDEPILEDAHSVLVRPLTVATCDMDGVVIHGMMPLKSPTPIGHEGEGVITEVGDAVSKWKVGVDVIIPLNV